jgi:hypothetical protein
MNRFVLFLIILCFFACADSSQQKTKVAVRTATSEHQTTIIPNSNTIDSTLLGIKFTPKGNYNVIKQSMKRERSYFAQKFKEDKKQAIDSASKYLQHKLLNELVPHWYGTPWDFNGHTNIPNDGEIACGYFVSTTLKHLGFRLNRYKMAQQGGLNEAITLQPKHQLKIYRNVTFQTLKNKLNKVYNDGLYFVGLRNHVGYIFIKNDELYFLHSSYYDNKVMIEKAETSPCFQSDIYVFAEITSNEKLIQKWIQNTPIPIHK